MTEIAVSENCERVSIEKANLQYIGEQTGWAGLWKYDNYQIELRIDGNEQSPYTRFVELAEIVLPKLAEIERVSNTYLRGFVSEDSFFTGLWSVQSLRMRQEQDSKRVFGSEFEVTLSIGEDNYGRWSVGFAYHTYPSRVLSPYFFSRRQW